MKELANGDRVLSPEEWNTLIVPALKTYHKGLVKVHGEEQIKPDNTGETNFNEVRPPIKEVKV